MRSTRILRSPGGCGSSWWRYVGSCRQSLLFSSCGSSFSTSTGRSSGPTAPAVGPSAARCSKSSGPRGRHEAAGRALVGLLTGNLERGAALKLRSAGLDPARFAVGAYGSDSGHRPDLPAIAAARAAQRSGRPVAGGDVVIIGDTPADVACGRPIGARTVAVATGSYDAAALRAAGAAHVFATLADTAAVLDAVLE